MNAVCVNAETGAEVLFAAVEELLRDRAEWDLLYSQGAVNKEKMNILSTWVMLDKLKILSVCQKHCLNVPKEVNTVEVPKWIENETHFYGTSQLSFMH